MSSEYENDKKLIEYCNQNTTDTKCQCILLSNDIKIFTKSSYSLPYCWYAPCNKADSYKTSIIKEEQKYCHVTVCEISFGEITLKDNGVFTATNNCISTLNPIAKYSQTIVKLKDDDIPNLIISFIYPITIVLLIFFISS
ncbi:ORF MSV142 putative membrane protein, fowlpox virus 15.6kD homolog (vaccinia J5L), similar to GB:M17418 [Melanoplus sanguinipes entomopoxvirus]|uniref:ORF MSV142 putative membrane protein, fowlpox virus 15.6kD homolog (Vaccinia J5L), similar to GB:M17418 n=1 Tax=Melanoplus sanguinipes entomopoxvirus TaxID=83191 RepID=Q9YVV0_MSEPV|nr:ORF MSV142 putative membrane protein, fowlpox virus 15.6kD homolog (vaccinia J5L), similar to GB:M17418 [Melanoplus sanguinipes entomopoxvirus]AAC97790.1 ORF MSV142 putative membrane protein, fowlpox virus 15.6kD homolog (vaccinia J5L), similar to GB:M17418 [Melanoplus sanguinipes entomopoxvirus 'O']